MTSPTATIAHALKGVDFPCSRDGLLEYARRNEAETGTIDLLSSMPERSYGSMSEVFRSLRKVREQRDEDEGAPGKIPPEPKDFYDEVDDPPPLAMPAPEPHQTEIMLSPLLWPWDFSIRYWQMVCDISTAWWKRR